MVLEGAADNMNKYMYQYYNKVMNVLDSCDSLAFIFSFIQMDLSHHNNS